MICDKGTSIGASYVGGGRCEFTVWAPLAKEMSVEILSPGEKSATLSIEPGGFWKTSLDGVVPGTKYLYRINGENERPDPASAFQPEGVHGPSEVVDHSVFPWNDANWRGSLLRDMIIYELHVGTFTPEGTFASAIPRIGELRDMGINAIEIMPVAQFPGERNWGYDGAYPFAVQNSYGGPGGLKRFIDACHCGGISVILDVVYNHLGPEGNYLRDFGPYFTPKYRTPWGEALNFDGPFSDGVRNFFLQNALHWFRNYHVDGLRLDAVHGITDMSANPFLQELSEAVKEYAATEGVRTWLIAESDLNDARLIRSTDAGGFGIDAQWCDDYHHALHTILTGEECGYYADFGKVGQLAKSLEQAYVYSGEYSGFRKRRHGNTAEDRPVGQFIVFTQNHDQIGNRMGGERLSAYLSLEGLKTAAGIVLLSPYIPLLFMGEEYGETNPFLYFMSHSDPELVRAVRDGRKGELCDFGEDREPPDPYSEATFLKSKLDWEKRYNGNHAVLLKFHAELIRIRKAVRAFACPQRKDIGTCADEHGRTLTMSRSYGGSRAFLPFNFNKDAQFTVGVPEGSWDKVIDSAESKWGGPGASFPDRVEGGREIRLAPESFAVLLSRK